MLEREKIFVLSPCLSSVTAATNRDVNKILQAARNIAKTEIELKIVER